MLDLTKQEMIEARIGALQTALRHWEQNPVVAPTDVPGNHDRTRMLYALDQIAMVLEDMAQQMR